MPAVEVPGARDLPDGRGVLLEVGAERIAVFRLAGRWYALDDVCPHRTGPLSEGALEITRKGVVLVTCPFHGWQFELATGRCDTVRGKAVRTYPVREDARGVFVELPDPLPEADPPASAGAP